MSGSEIQRRLSLNRALKTCLEASDAIKYARLRDGVGYQEQSEMRGMSLNRILQRCTFMNDYHYTFASYASVEEFEADISMMISEIYIADTLLSPSSAPSLLGQCAAQQACDDLVSQAKAAVLSCSATALAASGSKRKRSDGEKGDEIDESLGQEKPKIRRVISSSAASSLPASG